MTISCFSAKSVAVLFFLSFLKLGLFNLDMGFSPCDPKLGVQLARFQNPELSAAKSSHVRCLWPWV